MFDMGEEPTWLTCACGAQTNRVPCWECTQAADAKTKADERYQSCLRTIPAEYAWASLDAPELAKRVRTTSDLNELASRVLGASRVLFVGPAGAGKTTFAVACLRERLSRGAIFVPPYKLGPHRGFPDANYVKLVCEAPLVLLDDIGRENSNTSAVVQVLNERHDEQRATWFTTGLRHEQLLERYDDGSGRRTGERSRALIVNLGGKVPE